MSNRTELFGEETVRNPHTSPHQNVTTTSAPIDKENANIVVQPGSQIVWRVDDVSDGDTNVSCIWDYILIDD